MAASFSASASSAPVETETQFQEQWAKYFAGAPQIPDLTRHLGDLLVFDREKCGQTVNSVLDHLNEYRTELVHSNSGQATKLHEQIQNILSNASGTCGDSAYRAYAVGSLRLLDPFSFNLIINTEVDPSLREQTSYAGVVLLGVMLANRDYLEFWTHPEREGDNDLLGAYDCARTKISLDPKMRPVDLAATFVHELNHLFLDKFIQKKDIQFTTANGDIDWERFFLADEELAITHSAFLQKELSLTEHPSIRIGKHYELPLSLAHPYHVDGDLSLYQSGGPIEKLVKLTRLSDMIDVGEPETAAYNFLIGTIVSPGGGDTGNTGFKEVNLCWKLKNPVQKIRSTVFSAYFPGEPALEPPADRDHGFQDDSIALAQFPTWILNHSKVESIAFNNQNQNGKPQSEQLPPWVASMKIPHQINATWVWPIYFGIPGLLNEFDRLQSSFTGTSPVCQMYLDKVTSGQIDQYLGVRFSKKLNNAGMKSAIRPCISMKDKL